MKWVSYSFFFKEPISVLAAEEDEITLLNNTYELETRKINKGVAVPQPKN